MGADPRSVPEIAEAAALFEAWERSVNDVDAAKRFTEAVELLEDYLSGEPDSPHRAFVRNLKRANSRRLLERLSAVDRRDFGLWVEYAATALAAVKPEVEELLAAQPELRTRLETFLKL